MSSSPKRIHAASSAPCVSLRLSRTSGIQPWAGVAASGMPCSTTRSRLSGRGLCRLLFKASDWFSPSTERGGGVDRKIRADDRGQCWTCPDQASGEALQTGGQRAGCCPQPAAVRPGRVGEWLPTARCGGAATGAGSGFSAALIFSGVNGGSQNRTPVASKIAFAMAAVPGTEDDSPAPSGGSPVWPSMTKGTSAASGSLKVSCAATPPGPPAPPHLRHWRSGHRHRLCRG